VNAHALLPDWIVDVLGPDCAEPLAAADRGEDPRPVAREILARRVAAYDDGDRPPSPPDRLLRALFALDDAS
jgi:hypothetical protein